MTDAPVPVMRHPWRDLVAALATRHGKERAIAPPLARAIGLKVVVADVDTDRFGTFSGEIPRPGSPLETAVAKANAAVAATGARFGLASEGTFGPHPQMPFIAAGHETVVLVDRESGLVVAEHGLSEHTNFDHRVIARGDDLSDFLASAAFPAHALVVRPNAPEGALPVAKAVQDLAVLRDAIAEAAARSDDRCARIETDMRAHLNPTRMQEIRRVARRLARRLATPCPACAMPGFGRVDVERGLPCGECGTPTSLVKGEIWGCDACGHRESRPRPDGRAFADPAACPLCNP